MTPFYHHGAGITIDSYTQAQGTATPDSHSEKLSRCQSCLVRRPMQCASDNHSDFGLLACSAMHYAEPVFVLIKTCFRH